MPVSKRRKKPDKKRSKGAAQAEGGAEKPRAAAESSSGGGGLMSRMRGGIQSVAGAGPKKPETLISKIITWALVALVAYFVAKRFGIIK